MSFSINESQSAFVNPHTCQLTSNLQNTRVEEQDWETVKAGFSKLRPVDERRGLRLSGRTYIDQTNNSAQMADARLAYEIQKANNRTYEFADEKTKKIVRYRSEYYLSTAPDSVKVAWQEAMGETNINPFVVPYGNTIAQLAMEQDFATGGNNQLFGDTVSDSIHAVKSILERIDNPLGEVPEEDEEEYQIVSQREREFYMAFLSKLKELEAN